MSDEELLRTISEDLRSFYAEIIRQPVPSKVQAALARIDDVQSRLGNLALPGSRQGHVSPRS